MTYRIKNWDRHYETNDTRKLVSLHWVKVPNQQDSLAYRLIAAHPRGAEIFAAWVLILQVASKGRKDERGNLPLSPEELGIVTGFPADIFSVAIEYLKTPKIGWIEQSPTNPPLSPDTPGESPANPPLKEGTEGKEENTLGVGFGANEGRTQTRAEIGSEGKPQSAWVQFREPIERLFGKAPNHGVELKWNRLAQDLLALEATPQELEFRASHYRQCWPDAACTLNAIVNNWNLIPTLKPKVEKVSPVDNRPRHKTAAEIVAERGF